MNRARPAGSFAVLLPAAVVLCAGLGGCQKQDSEEKTDTSRGQADTPGIDDLRGMPYVGGVRTDENEVGGVVFRDPQRSCLGYNLYAVEALSMAELIDEDGRAVNSWRHQPSQDWADCELLANGDLLVVGAEAGTWPDGRPLVGTADDARYVLRLDWKGRVLWKRKLRVHHDIEVTPAGKLLVLSFQRRRIPDIHSEIDMREDQLTLLEPDGTVIESHSMLDAARRRPEVFPLKPVKSSLLGGPAWVDVFHSNAGHWMRHPHLVGRHPIYDLGNVLVTFRHQDRIVVFNWERNEVVWAWGDGELKGPHDAQVLASGHVLLFDNGLGRGFSRAIELDPLTGKIVWQYQAVPPRSFYTASKGSVQRLPNGNTLMAESDKGRAVEVTPEGETVWEFICPHKVQRATRAAIVRMRRYERPYVEAIVKAQGS